MKPSENDRLVSLDPLGTIWNRFFTVSPLVVIGTREAEQGGGYNLAPKHLAMPMGWQNYFGFVCTPRHRTYRNIKKHGAFTVSYPRPEQVEAVGRLAAPRDAEGAKPALDGIATFPAEVVDGVCMDGAYLYVECRLERFVERLGKNGLVIGSVAAVHVDQGALRQAEGDGASEQDQGSSTSSEEDGAGHPGQIPLLAYLDPGRYATVQQSHPFPFPKNFDRREAYPTEAGFADYVK